MCLFCRSFFLARKIQILCRPVERWRPTQVGAIVISPTRFVPAFALDKHDERWSVTDDSLYITTLVLSRMRFRSFDFQPSVLRGQGAGTTDLRRGFCQFYALFSPPSHYFLHRWLTHRERHVHACSVLPCTAYPFLPHYCAASFSFSLSPAMLSFSACCFLFLVELDFHRNGGNIVIATPGRLEAT